MKSWDEFSHRAVFREEYMNSTNPVFISTIVFIHLYIIFMICNNVLVYKSRNLYPIRGRAPFLTIAQSQSFLLIFYVPFLANVLSILGLVQRYENGKIHWLNRVLWAFWWPLRRFIIPLFAVKIFWIVSKTRLVDQLCKDNLNRKDSVMKFLLTREKFCLYSQIIFINSCSIIVFFIKDYIPDTWDVWTDNISVNYLVTEGMILKCFDFIDCMIAFWQLFLVKDYPNGFKVQEEVRFMFILTTIYWLAKNISTILDIPLDTIYSIFGNVLPFTAYFCLYLFRQILMDLFCVKIFSLGGINETQKPGKFVFHYLELFYFDDYCMPFFDDYLVHTDPDLADISTRIQRLAIYYDYCTRFEMKLDSNPSFVSKNILKKILSIAKRDLNQSNGEIKADSSIEEQLNIEQQAVDEGAEMPVMEPRTTEKLNDNMIDDDQRFGIDQDEILESDEIFVGDIQNESTNGFNQNKDMTNTLSLVEDDSMEDKERRARQRERLYCPEEQKRCIIKENARRKRNFCKCMFKQDYKMRCVKSYLDRLADNNKGACFHFIGSAKELMIMSELNKLKPAFEKYKKTKSFQCLYNKIDDFERITIYVYNQDSTQTSKN